VTPAGMQTAQQIMEGRAAKIGASEPEIRRQGNDEIVIHLAAVHNPARAARTIATTGQLQMFDFEPSLASPSVQGNQEPAPLPSLYSLLSAVQKDANKGSPQAYYLFKTTSAHPVVQGPAPNVRQLLLPYKKGKQPRHTQVLKVPAEREPVSCSMTNSCPGAGSNGRSKSGRYWYLLKLPAALTGRDLLESGIAADVDPNTGQSIVTLQFTGQGSRGFKRITKAEYDRGRVNAGLAGQLNAHDTNVISRYAGHNAIVLDGELQQTPYLDYTNPTLSQGIVGNAQITEPSAAVANRTALVLQSGSLPYRFEPIKVLPCAR
jgi:preprotein translocase subunit SecD